MRRILLRRLALPVAGSTFALLAAACSGPSHPAASSAPPTTSNPAGLVAPGPGTGTTGASTTLAPAATPVTTVPPSDGTPPATSAATGPAATGPATTGPAATSPLTTSPPTTGPAVPSAPVTTTGGGTSTAAVKEPLTGLIDMGIQTAYQSGQPFPTTDPSVLDPYAGDFAGIVVNESWSQLEPSPGIENWAPLDQSLAAVAAWNNAHPSTPLGVKLRIFAGYGAPAWVVAASGPPVSLQTAGGQKTIGEWWTTPFRQAWSAFQHSMAARYDSDPLVRAVSVSSCSSSTGEPFVVSGAPQSQKALAAAGWTPQAQESCLDGALADYSGWVHTQIDFAFNPLPTPSGPDTAFTDQVMQACAASGSAGGPVCVLGNNDVSPVAPSGRSGPAYSEISALEQQNQDRLPVYFQTAGPNVDCSYISTAIAYHASAVELWPPNFGYQGFAAVPAATLGQWNRALQGSGSPGC